MNLTCNKGQRTLSTKSTQQDLTEILTDKFRNAGSEIQGIALAIIKVILRKSSLTKFFVSIFKIS